MEDVFYDFETPQLCFVLEYHPTNLYELFKEKGTNLSVRQIQVNSSLFSLSPDKYSAPSSTSTSRESSTGTLNLKTA
jgi:hypothetical protein